MSVGLYTLLRTYVDGQVLGASDYVGDHQQHITNQNPLSTGAYSDTASQMSLVTDTGDSGTPSLAGSLAGELERLRFAIKHIKETISQSTMPVWFTKSYSVVVNNGTITTAKLLDGATSVQYIRTATNATTQLLVTDTILLSQGITLTRTRVRITGVLHARINGITNGVAGLNLKIKRGGTQVGIVASIAPGSTDSAGLATYVLEIVDAPGPGTYTYTLEGSNGSDGVICNVINTDSALKFEEIA